MNFNERSNKLEQRSLILSIQLFSILTLIDHITMTKPLHFPTFTRSCVALIICLIYKNLLITFRFSSPPKTLVEWNSNGPMASARLTRRALLWKQPSIKSIKVVTSFVITRILYRQGELFGILLSNCGREKVIEFFSKTFPLSWKYCPNFVEASLY